MKQRRSRVATPAVSLAALIVTLMAACSRAGEPKQFGEPIGADSPRVSLEELVAKPEAYKGKTVVVDGLFGGACGDGDFFFKDKLEIIEAEPPRPEVNSLKKGTPIRLYGLVKVRRRAAREASEKGEKEETGEASVRIVGKGVELR